MKASIDASIKKLLGILVLSCLLVSGQVMAQDYYVDAELGNDAWTGTLQEPNADNSDGPWKSLDKVFAFSLSKAPDIGFVGGDNIYFRRGQEFVARNGNGDNKDQAGNQYANILPVFGSSGMEYTTCVINSSCSVQSFPIVFDAYGQGKKPIFRVRVSKILDSQWIPFDQAVWVKEGDAYNTGWAFRTEYIWEDDHNLRRASSLDCLRGIGSGCPDGNWYHEFYTNGKSWAPVYYRPTSGSPQEHKVYYGRWGYFIFNDRSQITIRNISFRTNARPLRAHAINSEVSHITVENCDFFATEFGLDLEAKFHDIRNIRFINNITKYLMRPISMVGQGSKDQPGRNFHDSEIAYNTVLECNAFGKWTGDHDAFYFQNVNTSHIHHNIVKGGRCSGLGMWYGNGGTAIGNIIESNTISDVHGEDGWVALGGGLGGAPDVNTCYGNIIRYNVYINTDQGFRASSCSVDGQQKNVFHNNQFFNNGVNLLMRFGVRDWIFRDNVFISPQATVSEPKPAHIIHEWNYIPTAGIISNYNFFYPDGANLFGIATCTDPGACTISNRDPNSFTDFSGWKESTGQDRSSTAILP